MKYIKEPLLIRCNDIIRGVISTHLFLFDGAAMKKTLDLFGSFFDPQDTRLDKLGDPLARLREVVDWEAFRPLLERVRPTERKSNAGAPRRDEVLMFKGLVIQIKGGEQAVFKIFRVVALFVIMLFAVVPAVMAEIDVSARHKKSCPIFFNSSESQFYIADDYLSTFEECGYGQPCYNITDLKRSFPAFYLDSQGSGQNDYSWAFRYLAEPEHTLRKISFNSIRSDNVSYSVGNEQDGYRNMSQGEFMFIKQREASLNYRCYLDDVVKRYPDILRSDSDREYHQRLRYAVLTDVAKNRLSELTLLDRISGYVIYSLISETAIFMYFWCFIIWLIYFVRGFLLRFIKYIRIFWINPVVSVCTRFFKRERDKFKNV